MIEDEIESLSNKLDDIKSREEEELDEPIVKKPRLDLPDDTLDVPEPEELEKGLSKADIEKQVQPVKFAGSDIEDDDDTPEIEPSADYKLMRNSKGEYAVVMVSGNNKQFITMVPEKYVELAKRNVKSALDAMEDEREMSDDELMETLNEMLSEAKTEEAKIKKSK